jgi:RNA polymerase sigma factor (sigma-70 family)
MVVYCWRKHSERIAVLEPWTLPVWSAGVLVLALRSVAFASEPAQAAAPEGLRQDLDTAFRGLAEKERRLLWLAHVEGLEHKAIAAEIGAQAGSVRVMLFRARRRLAERLGLEKRENRSST